MKFDQGIPIKYLRSIEDAFDKIIEKGNEFHRHMAKQILRSDLLVRVQPVSVVNASGVTGLIDPGRCVESTSIIHAPANTHSTAVRKPRSV